jgi:hypothetical protein
LNLLAIDPSLTCTGWAFFEGPTLKQCGIVRTDPSWPLAMRIGRAAEMITARDEEEAWPEHDTVIEWPQVYTFGKSKGDPNDLLPVAGVAAVCAATLAYASRPAELVKPAAWKGQTPKDVHNARVLARLTPGELAMVDGSGIPMSLRNNVIDAIGLGLWKLGRMGRNHGDLGAANTDQETVAITSPGKRRRRTGRG